MKFSEYYREFKKQRENLTEDAVSAPSASPSAPSDGISQPSSTPSVSDGTISNPSKTKDHGLTSPDILGKCDHEHGQGFFGPGCFHLPCSIFGYPVYRFQNDTKKKRSKRKKSYDSFYKVVELKEGEEEKRIQGLEKYSLEELMEKIGDILEEKLSEKGLGSIEVSDFAVIGSRNRHTAKDDSDLDVVFEFYDQDDTEDDYVKEDYVFNEINDGNNFIDGIKIDFNPIREEETGTLEEYLDRAREYDEYVLGTLSGSETK